MLTYGFPPIASAGAEILVLGTLPSRMSVASSEYYANPKNAFWKIMQAGCSALPTEYSQRAAYLAENGVALWDVLAAAIRSGSMDADITDPIPNNFRALFHLCPEIRLVCFNGTTAHDLYRDHVLTNLDEPQRTIERMTLPSTSSAHARLTFEEKVARWSVVWN